MKNWKIKLLILFAILIFLPTWASALACPITTVGLSQNNQKGKFSEVFALQMILSQYPQIYPDALVVGNYGPKTEAAVKRLQADNGLNSNGVITQDTLDLICSQYYQCPFQSMIGRGDELNPEQKIEVKMLQYLLKYLPKVKYTGAVNGAIGAITEKSITKFQSAYNLYPTQILDFETNNELCKIFDKLNTESLSAPVVVTTTKPKTASPLNAICVAEPSNAFVNQKVEFLSQVFGGKTPYKYSWSGYASGNNKTSSNFFTSQGQYQATLKVTDANNTTVEAKCYALVGNQNKQVQQPITNIIPEITITPPTTNLNVSISMTSDFSEISGPSDTINIFWTTENAETCYATSAPDNSNWKGPLNLRGQKTITNINIAKGDAAIFTIVCNNKNKTEIKYTIVERK